MYCASIDQYRPAISAGTYHFNHRPLSDVLRVPSNVVWRLRLYCSTNRDCKGTAERRRHHTCESKLQTAYQQKFNDLFNAPIYFDNRIETTSDSEKLKNISGKFPLHIIRWTVTFLLDYCDQTSEHRSKSVGSVPRKNVGFFGGFFVLAQHTVSFGLASAVWLMDAKMRFWRLVIEGEIPLNYDNPVSYPIPSLTLHCVHVCTSRHTSLRDVGWSHNWIECTLLFHSLNHVWRECKHPCICIWRYTVRCRWKRWRLWHNWNNQQVQIRDLIQVM